MSFVRWLFIASVMMIPSVARADHPKLDDLLGKWELTDEVAGIPKGAVFDFQKDGKLVITATIKGTKQTFEFGYKLEGKVLELSFGEMKDTTEVTTLTADELVCRDNDGITATFKRVK